ncbi:PhzF family phenazine biosynthesis protein [Pseudoalteromonas fenneropenaei]|uniref:PhzF family phenazine biosynthesis protein n=1 Tax=Pseudoalteromonas fenneropenaei TaxID=1737459 RepID=A0ABV7CII8_9GAMM
MKLDIYIVDAFTDRIFAGNPAGVCITEQPLSETLMKQIAAELGASETAFLTLNDFRLQWFTRAQVEVALCGHGTLATACVLNELGLVAVGDEIAFKTQSGRLTAAVHRHHSTIVLPRLAVLETSFESVQFELDAFGLNPEQLTFAGRFGERVLLQVNSAALVRGLNPNFSQLLARAGRGVVICAPSDDPEYTLVSRYFAPWVGINEDPVTGSTHCALADHLYRQQGLSEWWGYQASARGGAVGVKLKSDEQVELTGNAVIALKGQLRV